MENKRGSKEKVGCQICGQVVTKAGLIGHMRWKHERLPNAPLIPVSSERAQPVKAEVRRNASNWEKALRVAKLLEENPTWKNENAVAIMSDTLKVSKQEAEDQLLKAKIARAIERDDADRKAKSDQEDAQIKAYFKAHPEALK
jgi:hypothetical protein